MLQRTFHPVSLSHAVRTCAYYGVRNVSFWKKFAYVLNGCPLINSPTQQKFEGTNMRQQKRKQPSKKAYQHT